MAEFHYQKCGQNEDILSVILSGRLDTTQCDYLFGCIEHMINSGYQKMILDCSNLTGITSLGLGMLVRVHSRMKKLGGDVKLAGVHGVVANVMSLVQLDRVLQMYGSVDEAITAHGG